MPLEYFLDGYHRSPVLANIGEDLTSQPVTGSSALSCHDAYLHINIIAFNINDSCAFPNNVCHWANNILFKIIYQLHEEYTALWRACSYTILTSRRYPFIPLGEEK